MGKNKNTKVLFTVGIPVVLNKRRTKKKNIKKHSDNIIELKRESLVKDIDELIKSGTVVNPNIVIKQNVEMLINRVPIKTITGFYAIIHSEENNIAFNYDVLCEISKYLTAKDVINFSLTCKGIYCIITRNYFLTRFYEKKYPHARNLLHNVNEYDVHEALIKKMDLFPNYAPCKNNTNNYESNVSSSGKSRLSSWHKLNKCERFCFCCISDSDEENNYYDDDYYDDDYIKENVNHSDYEYEETKEEEEEIMNAAYEEFLNEENNEYQDEY